MTSPKRRKKADRRKRDENEVEAEPQVLLASAVTTETIEWLMYGYLPWGKLVIIEGDPGIGKSLLTVDLAAAISTSRNLPTGELGQSGAVLMLECHAFPGQVGS